MKCWSGKLSRKFLFLITLGMFLSLLAAPAGAAGDEGTIAVNFLKFLRSDKTILAAEILDGNRLDPSLPPVTVGHLFHLDGGGYLLVSPDRSISPVKAYSLAGDFAALPPPYREALLAELELRARVALTGTGRTPLEAGMTETEKQWDFLLRLDEMRLPLAYTAGTYLLQTKWNQTYPYNKFLPAVGDQTVVAGCVNVAVAQVMRYYGRPVSSQGVASYVWDGPPSQTLKTILYRSFNWANMPETIDATTPEYQADEVALLLRDLGIANRTDFDFSGSSTSLNSQVLMENFGYSTDLGQMDNSDHSFLAKIQSEIVAEPPRPVLFSLPGHMTVVDGYSADNSGQKVHINMGWGGSADDFYFLNRPVMAGGYNFPTDAGKLEIYYNFMPCSGSDCYVNLETGDAINGPVITGDFNKAKDTDLYEVHLKGATTISGTRGYSNLALFMSIANVADGGIVFPSPDPNAEGSAGVVFNAGSLPAGKYAIRVSLCNDAGYCYNVDANNHYTVTLTSGTLTTEEKAAIDRGLDKPPVIGNSFPDLILNTNSGTRKILIDARDENGDAVTLRVQNSNPTAVGAVLNVTDNILELTPTGSAKVASQIVVTVTANGKTTEKAFTVMTDDVETAFGKTFTVGGTFAGQNDVRTSRTILDGECTITGSTVGYDNQYFYSTLRNASGGTLFAAGTTLIHSTFSRNLYLFDASLKQNPGGSYYLYQPGMGDQYLLSVSCPNADETTATIARLLGISLAGVEIASPGDVDGLGGVILADAVLALQILSGMDMTGKTIILRADANGDHQIGLAEALFILQKAAGLRSP